MEEYVVDSKYGTRPLMEIAPLVPQNCFAQRPNTDGNFPSQTFGNFTSPFNQGYKSNYYGRMSQGHNHGITPNSNSYLPRHPPPNLTNQYPMGLYNLQPSDEFSYPGVPSHRNSYIEPGYNHPVVNGIPHRQIYPYDQNVFQQPMDTSYLTRVNDHLPRTPLNQQGGTHYHHGNNAKTDAMGSDRDIPYKPKSAHYFYGPDGGLLSGPGDFFRNLEPREIRASQSEPSALRHFKDNDRFVDSSKTCEDFLVEAVLKFGKLRNVTVKNASPKFKTLPEFLVDELENHYRGIPETHVVLVAVNGSYSIYASPSSQKDDQAYEPQERPRTKPRTYIRYNTAQ